jgi:hypothetical protein
VARLRSSIAAVPSVPRDALRAANVNNNSNV